MRNFVPLADWISSSSARRTPPLRWGLTPATNRAFFLSCAKLGVGRISPPRNGPMRSSKAWAWLRLAMANMPSRHAAAPAPRMICRRVVIMLARPSPNSSPFGLLPPVEDHRKPAPRPQRHVKHRPYLVARRHVQPEPAQDRGEKDNRGLQTERSADARTRPHPERQIGETIDVRARTWQEA